MPCHALNNTMIPSSSGPPRLTKPVKKQYTVKEGKTVKLRCKVSGIMDSVANRTLTAWQKLPERFVITNNLERFRMKLGRYLRITNVTLSDSGTYACIAKNSHGTISHNINLIVRGKCRVFLTDEQKPNCTNRYLSVTQEKFRSSEPHKTQLKFSLLNFSHLI